MRVKLEKPLLFEQIKDGMEAREIASWWGVSTSTLNKNLKVFFGADFNFYTFTESLRAATTHANQRKVIQIINEEKNIFPADVQAFWEDWLKKNTHCFGNEKPIDKIRTAYLGLLSGQGKETIYYKTRVSLIGLHRIYDLIDPQVRKRRQEIATKIAPLIKHALRPEELTVFEQCCVLGKSRVTVATEFDIPKWRIWFRQEQICKKFPGLRGVVIAKDDRSDRLEKKAEHKAQREGRVKELVEELKDVPEAHRQEVYNRSLAYRNPAKKAQSIKTVLPLILSEVQASSLPENHQTFLIRCIVASKLLIGNIPKAVQLAVQLRNHILRYSAKNTADYNTNEGVLFGALLTHRYVKIDPNTKELELDIHKIDQRLGAYRKIESTLWEQAVKQHKLSLYEFSVLRTAIIKPKRIPKLLEKLEPAIESLVGRFGKACEALQNHGYSKKFSIYMAGQALDASDPVEFCINSLNARFQKAINSENSSKYSNEDYTQLVLKARAGSHESTQELLSDLASLISPRDEAVQRFILDEIQHALLNFPFTAYQSNVRAVFVSLTYYFTYLSSVPYCRDNQNTIGSIYIKRALGLSEESELEEDSISRYITIKSIAKDYADRYDLYEYFENNHNCDQLLKKLSRVFTDSDVGNRIMMRSVMQALFAFLENPVDAHDNEEFFSKLSCNQNYLFDKYPLLPQLFLRKVARYAARLQVNPEDTILVEKYIERYLQVKEFLEGKQTKMNFPSHSIAVACTFIEAESDKVFIIAQRYLANYIQVFLDYLLIQILLV